MVARHLICAAAAAALLAGPAAARPKGPPKPTVVAQAQPGARILNDVRDLVRLAGGPKDGDKMVMEFQKGLENLLGEKGFDGLDLNRPVAAYVTVREKFDESSVVVVVPVTGDKEFVGLLERMKLTPAPVAGKDGLFTIEIPRDPFPKPSHVRLANGWAYVEFNGDDVADPAALVPAAELIDPAEQALVAVKLYPDRFPAALLKEWLDEMDKNVGEIKQFLVGFQEPHVGAAFGTTLDEGPKLLRRFGESLQKEAKEVVLRVILDPVTRMDGYEVVVTPKPGTELAKAIAARTATTNRFAGLVPADAAAGFVGQTPGFTPEVRTILAAWIGALKGEANKTAEEAVRPFLTEVFDGLARAAKAGENDFAVSILGPDKDGAFTLAAAVAFDDPTKLEKELRELARNPAAKKYLTLDADKVGGVAVHKVTLAPLLAGVPADAVPTSWGKLVQTFGKEPLICVALTPKAVYAAAGPDPVAALKGVMAAKPGPAPALGVVANPARLHKLAERVGGKEGAKVFADTFGTTDKRTDLSTVTLEGGPALRIRVISNTKYQMRLNKLMESAVGGGVEP
jgi:hypothetical protein